MYFLAYSKVIGRSHEASGDVCQDAVKVASVGDFFTLALSDGAGSAARSDEGSNALVSTLTEYFSKNKEIYSSFSLENIQEHVCLVISQVRTKLIAKGELNLFHATLVFMVGNQSLVHVFHLGDGAGLVGERISKNEILLHRSDPHNGEFSNETYFFTEDSWQTHLRSFSVKNPEFCIVCSDGVDPFLWDSAKGTRIGFLKPLLSNVLSAAGDLELANKALLSIISDPRADQVTSDDKSLAVMCNSNLGTLDGVVINDLNKPVVKDQAMLNEALNQAFLKNQKPAANPESQKNQVGVARDSKQIVKNLPKNKKSITYVYLLIIFLTLALIGSLATIFFISDSPPIKNIRDKGAVIFRDKNAESLKKENIETIVIDKSVPKTDIDKSDERTDEKKKLPEKNSQEVIKEATEKKVDDADKKIIEKPSLGEKKKLPEKKAKEVIKETAEKIVNDADKKTVEKPSSLDLDKNTVTKPNSIDNSSEKK
jgi:hypothetical protein